MKIVVYTLAFLCLHRYGLGALTRKPSRVKGTCGGEQIGEDGVIASPNFPDGPYPPMSKCNYTVTVPEDYIIKFEFAYMDLEDGPIQKLGSCFADYLTITEVNNEDSSMVGGQRFCGMDTPFKPVFTRTNRAFVWFRSDETLDFDGFVLKWNAVKPVEEVFDCDFEMKTGFCHGWGELATSVRGRWKVNHGSTRSSRYRWVTGPSFDHTKGNMAGAYAYVEATGMREGELASLVSAPANVMHTERYCLNFWYHMYGNGMGTFTVYEAQDNKGSPLKRGSILFRHKGEQGPGWKEASVTINRRDAPLRIIFEVKRGKNYRSDVAIDDITISENKCIDPK